MSQPAARALLAEALRRHLRQRRLTSKAFAADLRMSLASVEGWLAGSTYPEPAQLRLLASLGVEVGAPVDPAQQPEFWTRYARFLAVPDYRGAADTLTALWDHLQGAGLPCTLYFDVQGKACIDFFHQLKARGRVSFEVGETEVLMRFSSPLLRDTVLGDWVPMTWMAVRRLIDLARQVMTQPPPELTQASGPPELG